MGSPVCLMLTVTGSGCSALKTGAERRDAANNEAPNDVYIACFITKFQSWARLTCYQKGCKKKWEIEI